jgi:hypothetical protein
MADITTVADLATAGGTLVLAIATFSAVRSANRSTRIAEEALLAGIRPLLLTARFEDPVEKITWMDQHFTKASGGRGMFEEENGVYYFAAAVRNVGTGLAILHGWAIQRDPYADCHGADEDAYRRLNRDLYIAPNDNGFWQGAIRDGDDPDRHEVEELFASRDRFAIDVLYGDQHGGQRVVTRFGFTAYGDDAWLCTTSRHWFIDREDPR